MKASAVISGSSRNGSSPPSRSSQAPSSPTSDRAAVTLLSDWPEAVGPGGKVYAVDVDRDMTGLIAKRAADEQRSNIDVILAKPDDPLLPETGVDLVFTCNTYHHLEKRVAYFTKVREYLRPNGRVAIIDLDGRAWLEGLLRHYTPRESIVREMEQAGYELQHDFDFLDRQSFLIFVPKS